MILIKKGNVPKSLIAYRKKFDARFDNLPASVKDELREALLSEQGYLCAYCMCRINEKTAVKIEHYAARTVQNELNYRNLLACCLGGENGLGKERTCDTKKGSRVLMIDPQNKEHMNSISYRSSDGTIFSHLGFEKDFSDVLNINNKLLKRNRLEIIQNLNFAIYKKFKNNSCSKSFLVNALNKYRSKDSNGRLTEYAGVYIWYFSKKLKRFL
jgi:uncharacterized protein (TIGR02646 family)